MNIINFGAYRNPRPIINFTFYVLRFTFYVLHFTFYVLHFTFCVLTFHYQLSSYITSLYIAGASDFVACSEMFRTSTFSVFCPKRISITSPVLTSYDAFALRPLTLTRSPSQASFATVRLLINRETFRYLSSRKPNTSFCFFCGMTPATTAPPVRALQSILCLRFTLYVLRFTLYVLRINFPLSTIHFQLKQPPCTSRGRRIL